MSFKNLLIRLGRLYFVPFRYSSNLYWKVKDIYYTSSSEFLYRFLEKLVASERGENQYVIDVGAADGKVSLFLKKKLPKAAIMCFEPNPYIWPKLERNIEGQSIELRKIAVSNKSGVEEFHITDNNLSSSLLALSEREMLQLPKTHQELLKEKQTKQVKVSTLDLECMHVASVLVLKLDVQGAELMVLQGATQLLKRTRFILLEMSNHRLYHNGSQYYEVDEYLRNSGFSLSDIIVAFRTDRRVQEYDAIYERKG
jgi:FkbM family methyltransferase